MSDKWFCDSAATANYHTGEKPDPRALAVLSRHSVTTNHRARKLKPDDFTKFEYIFGMDHDNIRNIKRVAPENATAKIELLGSYDPQGVLIIEDPYYKHGELGFEENYEQCMRSCQAFLDKNVKWNELCRATLWVSNQIIIYNIYILHNSKSQSI